MNHPTADQSALKETQDEDGLLSSYEFVLLANGNMELMRQRFYISCFQALFDVFTLVLFSHFLGPSNFYTSALIQCRYGVLHFKHLLVCALA
jgi:hypothetical protein